MVLHVAQRDLECEICGAEIPKGDSYAVTDDDELVCLECSEGQDMDDFGDDDFFEELI